MLQTYKQTWIVLLIIKEKTMNTLEIILIAIIWIAYGVFNASQHDWYKEDYTEPWFFVLMTVICAPIILVIRIFRGVFFWKGKY